MKNLKFLLLILFTTFFLASCESDDDYNIDDNRLLGAWYLVDETVDGFPVDIRCDFIIDFYRYTVTTFDYYGFNCASLNEYTNEYYIEGDQIVNLDQNGTFYVDILSLSNSRLVLRRFDEYYLNGQVFYEEVITTYIPY